MKKSLLICFAVLFGCVAQTYGQEIKSYDVNFAASAPTIDGVVSPGEWDTATEEAGWTLLRTAGTPDGENSRFRAMWDTSNLYLLFQSDKAGFNGPATGAFDGNADNLNFYFDPNTDGEANAVPGPQVDGYQFAINQAPGTTGSGVPTFIEAHTNTPFGNNSGAWSEFANADFDQVNSDVFGGTGGLLELMIPWTDFDAPGIIGTDEGLFHPQAPNNGDDWFFNISRISSDSSNFLPVWNNNGEQSFAFRPHGTITFIGNPAGVPEPSGGIIVGAVLVFAGLRRRSKSK